MPKTDPKPLPVPTQAEIDRFWARVDKTHGQGPKGSCWRWLGGVHRKTGYGYFKYQRMQAKAHRVSFFLYYGADPMSSLICHSCDQVWCVSPECAFLGSNADNTADSVRKNRRATGLKNWRTQHPESTRGTLNPAAKLTEEQVREIRSKAGTYFGVQSDLARKFGVTPAEISHIVHRRSYGWME